MLRVLPSEPSIRQTVLGSLDARFDNHLCQAENVRALFIALNDEVFAIRELAISIIGRLTVHNPAYVMPSLRKTLIQLLTDLEYSVVGYVATSRPRAVVAAAAEATEQCKRLQARQGGERLAARAADGLGQPPHQAVRRADSQRYAATSARCLSVDAHLTQPR